MHGSVDARRVIRVIARASVLVVAIAAVVSGVACGSAGGGLGLSAGQDGRVLLYYRPPCEDDPSYYVTDLRLSRVVGSRGGADDVTIWAAEDSDGSTDSEFTIGSASAGFRETVPLTESPDDTVLLVVTVESRKWRASQAFTYAQLRGDMLLDRRSGDYMPEPEFLTYARYCS